MTSIAATPMVFPSAVPSPATSSQAAEPVPTPRSGPPPGSFSHLGQTASDTHTPCAGVGAQNSGSAQAASATQKYSGGPGHPNSTPSHSRRDTHDTSAGGGDDGDPGGPTPAPTPRKNAGRRDADLLIYFYADLLDDYEDLRVATANRLDNLTDPSQWGKGVNPDLIEVDLLRSHLDHIESLEHGAELALKRAMRSHYLHPWQQDAVGVGEKQLARLLAAIGNPWWHDAEDRPRTVSELWAYCGYHVVDGRAAKLSKGRQANWSTEAKTRAWLVANSCIKQRHSRFRQVYDDRRAHTDENRDWSDGHCHNDALRIVAKEILKELWRAARDATAGPRPTRHPI